MMKITNKNDLTYEILTHHIQVYSLQSVGVKMLITMI